MKMGQARFRCFLWPEARLSLPLCCVGPRCAVRYVPGIQCAASGRCSGGPSKLVGVIHQCPPFSFVLVFFCFCLPRGSQERVSRAKPAQYISNPGANSEEKATLHALRLVAM